METSKNLKTKYFHFSKQTGSYRPGVSDFACSAIIGAFSLGPLLNSPKLSAF